MKDIQKILGIGLLIGTVLFIINVLYRYSMGIPVGFNAQMLTIFGYQQLFSIVLTAVNYYFFNYLDCVEWGRFSKYRIAVGIVGSIVITMLTLFLLKMFVEVVIEGEPTAEFFAEESKNGIYYLLAFIITLTISAVFHAVYFYKESQKKKVTRQKIIAGAASAQFDALKNQLDPHFLFNSLNVLTSLIDENPDSAQNFTASLSKVYRYVLEQKNKELVSVEEELEFAKTYIKLLQMRFEDSIVCNMPNIIKNNEAKVVPLSLQLLLENAVKHNVASPKSPLQISIIEIDNTLVVENNLQPKQVIKKSSGVGLANIVQRYELLTDRKVHIEESKNEFRVILPLLTQKINIVNTQQDYLDEKRYKRAKEKLENIKGFYYNLFSYILVIPFLAFINYQTSDFPWIVFPLFGWGFGIIMHGLEAFGFNPIMGKDWEERKIREFMDKE
ncbi:MAG: histidine kinase [Flavobacteriales bacterium]|nr:MAG: histidine kinase [Flavobacteriales bacterium]